MNITKTNLREENQPAKDMIDSKSKPGYYGKLTFSFENGRVVVAREEKTHKF